MKIEQKLALIAVLTKSLVTSSSVPKAEPAKPLRSSVSKRESNFLRRKKRGS